MCVQALYPGAKPRFPPPMAANGDKSVSLFPWLFQVIPAWSAVLLSCWSLKTLGKKSPEQAGLALLAASQQWERGG